jgi:hypothetical protein
MVTGPSPLSLPRSPAGGLLERFHLLVTQANGCPAFGLMVLMLAGRSIVTITGFPDPALFARFGLPECL